MRWALLSCLDMKSTLRHAAAAIIFAITIAYYDYKYKGDTKGMKHLQKKFLFIICKCNYLMKYNAFYK